MNIVSYIQAAITSNYSEEERRVIAARVLEHVAAISATDLAIDPALKLSAEKHQVINAMIERINANEPLAYVLGEVDFFGITIYTDKRALIPRPETEELVMWVVESCAEARSILDIGTGSGCIAVSLAVKLKNAHLTAFDISLDALDLAHENATEHNVLIDFYHVNILKTDVWDKSFDVIVSNPPYVMQAEKEEMDDNVLHYEPESALFVTDDEPLLFYRYIAAFAYQHLTEDGSLFLEINQALGEQTVALLHSIGFKQVELRKDLSGNDRMIRAQR